MIVSLKRVARLPAATQVGALQRMGVRMTDAEAIAVVNYYDVDGTGEMSYDVRETGARLPLSTLS